VSSPLARPLVVAALAALLVVTAAVAVTAAPEARAADRATVMKSAAAYGPKYDYKMGIAVYDTKLHKFYGSGSYRSTFASESVIKAMIATRLILQGRMHGSTAQRAYKMITQSDDGIASAFYGSVGGDNLINWIKRRYRVPDLGTPPHRAGWWGNTHITAAGLVKFYAKVKWDRRVGPWLINAMHHARKYGSGGTYQFFGLPSATRGAAVKQGWGIDYDDWGRSADFNTTGFVNGDRYTVAILARGPARTYGSAIGNALTQTARRLLPGGRFPDGNPVIAHMSHRSGSTNGGQRINVRGRDLNGASAVYFGGVKGTALRRISSTELAITTPPHAAGRYSVRVQTYHGWSTPRSYYLYVRPPAVTSVSPASGPITGGTQVTLRGSDFSHLWSVWFGSRRATNVKIVSTQTLTAVVPPGAAAQPVSIVVTSWYGRSTKTAAATFTYLAAPGSTSARSAPPSPAASPSREPTGPAAPTGATPSPVVRPTGSS